MDMNDDIVWTIARVIEVVIKCHYDNTIVNTTWTLKKLNLSHKFPLSPLAKQGLRRGGLKKYRLKNKKKNNEKLNNYGNNKIYKKSQWFWN